jgi:hypothetical protein
MATCIATPGEALLAITETGFFRGLLELRP